MKRTNLIIAAAAVSTVAIIGLSATAFAWHPEGKIIKKVQNITTGSALSDADTAAQAVAVKPGDTLKYVIEVSNVGKTASNGYNDMDKTVMTDTLPAGVELVSNPAQRQITENLGLLKPGQKVTKEYTVKVTAATAGTIQNTACFTGDSTANDNPQKGCNPAVVKVSIPPKSEVPVTPVTPKTPAAPAVLPAELPRTGAAENALVAMLAIGASWYAVHRYLASKRELRTTLSQL